MVFGRRERDPVGRPVPCAAVRWCEREGSVMKVKGGGGDLQAMKRPALLRASDEDGKETDKVLTGCKFVMGTVTRRN